MVSARHTALALALVALPASARAQTAPWQLEASDAPAASPPPAPPAESAPIATERYGVTPDPAFTYNFQMPTARPLHRGDTMIGVASDLGWLSVRYGFTRHFDAGVGLPFYLAGISADARYELVAGENSSLSMFGYVTIPFMPGTGSSASFLGFNWQGAGPAWVLGPLLSLWGARAGLHIGVHVAQRVLLGGAWAMVHLTVEGRITDAVRAIAQGVVLAEVVDESGGTNAHPLLGNTQPRVFPYVVGGLRLHSRRFAVDFGMLLALASDSPLAGGSIGIWPWTSVSQTF